MLILFIIIILLILIAKYSKKHIVWPDNLTVDKASFLIIIIIAKDVNYTQCTAYNKS